MANPKGWHKGMVSPNPSGRPKDHLKRLAREAAPEVVGKLLAIINATPAADPTQPQMAAFALFLDFFDWAPPIRVKPASEPPMNERRAAQL